MRRDEETELQKTVAGFLDIALPGDVVFTAVNPIPAKSKAAAGLSKAMGLKRGVSDLVFWWPDRNFGVIELKSATGVVSPEQRGFMNRIIAAGGRAAIARDLETVAEILTGWGIKLRASVGGSNVGSHMPALSSVVRGRGPSTRF